MTTLGALHIVLCARVVLAWSGDAQADSARDLYREGARCYERGAFDCAISFFQRAYDVSSAPELLFNLAQAYRLKGPESCGSALTYYERALTENPSAGNAAEIAKRIDEMRECVGQAAVEPAPALLSPTPAAASSWHRDVLTYAATGAGVVAVVAGMIIAARAETQIEYNQRTYGDYAAATDAVGRRRIGYGLIGGGLGLVAFGVVRYVFASP